MMTITKLPSANLLGIGTKEPEMIFPLAIAHFDETVLNLNRERRKRLATYMILASRGWAILPVIQIMVPEIKATCVIDPVEAPGILVLVASVLSTSWAISKHSISSLIVSA
jgi:hypothetical protein